VVLLEQADRPGAFWAHRWDSLRLSIPARYDALPGSTFPAPWWSHPGKDEVAAYLARDADQQHIPVSTGARVVAGLSDQPW
jgi:putative flavoprotein involved in K+ transport